MVFRQFGNLCGERKELSSRLFCLQGVHRCYALSKLGTDGDGRGVSVEWRCQSVQAGYDQSSRATNTTVCRRRVRGFPRMSDSVSPEANKNTRRDLGSHIVFVSLFIHLFIYCTFNCTCCHLHMYVLSGSHKSFLSLATPVIPCLKWSCDVIFVKNKLELSWPAYPRRQRTW